MVELSGKDADKFLEKMIERENSPPTEKEKKLFEEIMKDRVHFQSEKLIKCDTCGEQLIGIEEVNKHKDANWDHFTYTLLGSNAKLGFA